LTTVLKIFYFNESLTFENKELLDIKMKGQSLISNMNSNT
jgi:hypothetical protein